MNTSSEQFRLECEAQEWLRLGYNSKHMAMKLHERIMKRRGKKAADELIQEMLRQRKILREANGNE